MNVARISALTLVCCLIALAWPSNAYNQGDRSSLRVNGTVIGIGGRFAGRSAPFSLIVKSPTSVGQVRELTETLGRGQDALLNALSKMEAGRVQIGTGVGVPANAVIVEPWGDGGTKLTVFYQRNLSFYELRYGTRSQDYPIGYAEIFLDRNRHGEGSLIPAARVRLKSGNTWEVEDFGVYPARLMGLRASGQLVPR